MSIQLIDCPACGSKISSQAGACPHCGQPIRPVLYHQDKTNLFVAENFKLNLHAGFEAIVIQGVIVFFMVWSLFNKLNEFLVIMCIFYLCLWGWYIVQALKKNETSKILLLIFLPVLGIILCSLLTPQENRKDVER